MTSEEILLLQEMMEKTIEGKLQELRTEMKEQNQALRIEMKEQNQELRTEMKEQNQQLRTEMKEENQKLFMNIVDLVETQATQLGMKYEHEVSGKINALNEETDVLRDDVKDHEQRIYTVERKIGLVI